MKRYGASYPVSYECFYERNGSVYSFPEFKRLVNSLVRHWDKWHKILPR